MRDKLLVAGLAGLTLAAVIRLRSEPAPDAPAPFALLEGRTLHLAGTASEKGRAHGRILKDRIRMWLDRVRPAEPGVREFAIRTCGDRILAALPAAIREEVEGIAEGAGVSVHDALFLTSRFELDAHGLVAATEDFGARPMVSSEGPGVRWEATTGTDLDELILFVHEDGAAPLAFVGLPGMVGGWMGVRGPVAAGVRLLPSETRPLLSAAPWPVLLRRLLQTPPDAGSRLPIPTTRAACVALVQPGGEVGTLVLSPAGGTWYPGLGRFEQAGEHPLEGSGGRVTRGERTSTGTAAGADDTGRAIFRETGPRIVRLLANPGGVELTIGGRRQVVRFRR